MILPDGGSTLIKDTIGEVEYLQVFKRVPHFTVAKNGVMLN
jgi:hypothetical protein